MKNLKNLQNKFIDAVYKENEEVLASVVDKNIEKIERLEIYRNNLYGTLSNALRITFTRSFGILKEKKFNKIAYKYIDNNRSKSGNLDDYGENFCDFMPNAFLADIARLDWLCLQIYLKKYEQEIDLEKLQKVAPEKLGDLKFLISKSLIFLDSYYNLISKDKKKRKNKLHFIVYRNKNDVIVERISNREFVFLSFVNQGLEMFEIYKKCGFAIDKYLQKFIANRVFVGFFE